MAATASAAPAGFYPPGEPVPFAVGADGAASELPYEPQFRVLLDERLNARLDVAPGGPSAARTAALAKLAAAPAKPSAAEAVGLASLELRVGRADAAVNRLRPLALARNPDYLALVTLAQAHAVRGEWNEAKAAHEAAVLDADAPAALPGATPDQTRWLFGADKKSAGVEKKYVSRWLAVRAAEPARGGADTQQPPDVFQGVRFVGESGQYEPGKLAAAERAKLPPDAVAVVQQLALWEPEEPRLLWLLAELYAADGRVRDAAKAFDQCTIAGRNFTTRPVLMAHRRSVLEAVDRLPRSTGVDALPPDPAPPTAPAEPAGVPREVFEVAAGVVAVAVVMLGLQVRAWVRRARR